MADLLTTTSTEESAEAVVAGSGVVRRTFDHLTQDAGNVSWLVAVSYTHLTLPTKRIV